MLEPVSHLGLHPLLCSVPRGVFGTGAWSYFVFTAHFVILSTSKWVATRNPSEAWPVF